MAVTCKYACDIPSIFYENKNYEIKKLGLKLTPFQAVLSLIHFRSRGLKLFFKRENDVAGSITCC